MDIVKDILDNIINYSLFFYNDEIVEKEHLEKYIMYVKKKINNNYCNLYFEKYFSIKHIDDVITIEEYINRLIINCRISNSIMICAIIYLEKNESNFGSVNGTEVNSGTIIDYYFKFLRY